MISTDDSISIEKLLTFYERRAKELKGVYGDLGGACNGVAKSIKLLTAQPERKKGHWILHYDEIMLSDGTSISGAECSKCGWKKYDKIYRLIACPYNFCPNCGAYMKEEQDE